MKRPACYIARALPREAGEPLSQGFRGTRGKAPSELPPICDIQLPAGRPPFHRCQWRSHAIYPGERLRAQGAGRLSKEYIAPTLDLQSQSSLSPSETGQTRPFSPRHRLEGSNDSRARGDRPHPVPPVRRSGRGTALPLTDRYPGTSPLTQSAGSRLCKPPSSGRSRSEA